MARDIHFLWFDRCEDEADKIGIAFEVTGEDEVTITWVFGCAEYQEGVSPTLRATRGEGRGLWLEYLAPVKDIYGWTRSGWLEPEFSKPNEDQARLMRRVYLGEAA